MRFTLNPGAKETLSCELCGGEKFVQVPGRQVCDSDLVAGYVFFRCEGCSHMGFWTHTDLINKKKNVSRAIQKEVSRPNDPPRISGSDLRRM